MFHGIQNIAVLSHVMENEIGISHFTRKKMTFFFNAQKCKTENFGTL